MTREFNVVIEKDGDGYFVATVPGLRGCHTQAKSLDELMERIQEAIALCLEFEKVGGDKVMGDKNTYYHSQNLAQAAQEIKALLEQLDQDYDRTTPTGQAMIGAKTIEAIEKNPTLKARVINALKEGGTTALEVAVDHPAVKPVVALLKGFMDAE